MAVSLGGLIRGAKPVCPPIGKTMWRALSVAVASVKGCDLQAAPVQWSPVQIMLPYGRGGGGGILDMASLQPALTLSCEARMHCMASRPSLPEQSFCMSVLQAFCMASRAAIISGDGGRPPGA